MKGKLFYSSGIAVCLLFSFSALAQNVGIGTGAPDARLHVVGTSGSTYFKAVSTNDIAGISLFGLSNRYPVIGFNLEYNGVYKYLSDGFGFMMLYDQTEGDMTFYTTPISGTANNTAGFANGTSAIFYPNGNKNFPAYTGFNVLPHPDSGRVSIAHNSTLSSPTLQLIEQSTTDYARLELSNTANTRFWHIAGNNSSTTVADDRLNFFHSSAGDIISIRGDGRVGIGGVNSHAAGYKLSVNGKVICEELRVQNSVSWPDYVFADQYQLMPLQQVSDYIKANKHLPGIPSAKEVEKDGIAVGDMQKRMMEKIEELTLYVIQLQQEIEALKQKEK